MFLFPNFARSLEHGMSSKWKEMPTYHLSCTQYPTCLQDSTGPVMLPFLKVMPNCPMFFLCQGGHPALQAPVSESQCPSLDHVWHSASELGKMNHFDLRTLHCRNEF